MAQHKSAIKRYRQSLKRRERNVHYRTTVKTLMKKALSAVEESGQDAAERIKLAIATVDKVAGKGIIPKNRASRYVSRLTRKLAGTKE